MLYCIVGPSGCGKSTVVDELNKLGYKSPDSYTTRPKRYPEETGHTFITEDEYDKLENIVAYTVFNGYRYCVTKEMLEDCDFYIVDPPGVKTLRENSDIDIKVIGLELEPISCAIRMLSRGDKPNDVIKRLENDWYMFRDFDEICDYRLDAGEDVSQIVKRILNIMLD